MASHGRPRHWVPSRIRTPISSATRSGRAGVEQAAQERHRHRAHHQAEDPVERGAGVDRPPEVGDRDRGGRRADDHRDRGVAADLDLVAARGLAVDLVVVVGPRLVPRSAEARLLRLGCALMLSLQGGDDLVEVVGLDEHVAGLGALARPDDAAALEDVHQAAGLGEADPQLALQHRGRPELRGDDELDRLEDEVQVVADVVVELALGGGRGGDVLAVRRLQLLLAVLDDLVDLGLGDPGALHAHRLGGAHRQEQPVALADELLRARLVEDDPAVGELGGERQPGRHVGLDQAGDHVDARAAGWPAPGGCRRPGRAG